MRRSNLARKTPLKPSRRLVAVDDPARVFWKTPVAGFCTCGCMELVPHLERHHVLTAETVKRYGGDLWDLRNSMLLAPLCHARHTSAFRKIHLDRVPDEALQFASALLGEHEAAAYFMRRYDMSRGLGEAS